MLADQPSNTLKLLEHHVQLGDPFADALLDVQAHLLEEVHHGSVLHQHLCREIKKALPFAQAGERGEQRRPDPLRLVIISHGKGNLCGVARFVNRILPGPDDRLLPLFLQSGQDDHLLRVVDDHKSLKALMWHVPSARNALWGHPLLFGS